jgi:hypothetical protein
MKVKFALEYWLHAKHAFVYSLFMLPNLKEKIADLITHV